jgi:hypothetical protein
MNTISIHVWNADTRNRYVKMLYNIRKYIGIFFGMIGIVNFAAVVSLGAARDIPDTEWLGPGENIFAVLLLAWFGLSFLVIFNQLMLTRKLWINIGACASFLGMLLIVPIYLVPSSAPYSHGTFYYLGKLWVYGWSILAFLDIFMAPEFWVDLFYRRE